VASVFIPNPLQLPESQHKNGNRLDNRVSNLKWGTQKDNAADRDAHGNTMRGTRNPMAKLDPDKVIQIRAMREGGSTFQSIAESMSVSKKLIMLVIQGKIWTHVN
jgi:hypothetical protein